MPRPLSPREREVTLLLCHGSTMDEVAEKLGISRSSVESHKRRIYLKADVSSRLALYQWARAQELID